VFKLFVLLIYVCVFGIFSPVCFELSVPVQVIAWKDSSLKLPVRHHEWDVKLYSLTHLG